MRESTMTLKLKRYFCLTDKIDYLRQVISQVSQGGVKASKSNQKPVVSDRRVPAQVTPRSVQYSLQGCTELWKAGHTPCPKRGERWTKAIGARPIWEERRGHALAGVDVATMLALPWAKGLYFDKYRHFQRQERLRDTLTAGQWLKENIRMLLKALDMTEALCNTPHEEYLATVWAVVMSRAQVKETHVVMRTNHQTLKGVTDLGKSSEHLARRRLRLTE